MKKGTVIAAAALAAIVAIGLLWRDYTHSRADEQPARPSAPPLVANTPVAAGLDIPRPPASGSSLAPAELPFGAFVDDLKQRASNGEPGAMCRLAAEYAYCAQLPYRKAELDRWLSERQRALDLMPPEARQMAASGVERDMPLRQDRVTELEMHCKGVDPMGTRDLVRLWRRAALAGNPAAMKQYAAGNAFRWGSLLDALPELEVYKRDAERVAIIAAQRGDFDVLLSLAASYSPSQTATRSLLAQVIKPDKARSLALYRKIATALANSEYGDERIAREVQDRIQELQISMTQEDLQRADQIAARELQRWDTPVIRGVGRLDTTGRQQEIDRGWCAR